ncbi:hypothetical protein HGRIS_013039 [Hohenbuehelia grisea]|uniref:PUM-HD domain-containing protein n=1 Tax=Hohenbuehelia grisea TaxID=104357 RepID=A0ABR3IUE2_9AGAR
MSHHNGASSRKPSGSSTHSGARSRASSPGHAQSQRKFVHAAPGGMYGVGIGHNHTARNLNAGWQVWGSATSPSQRNVSASSATSVPDLPATSGDASYRSGAALNENWSASRPVSGTWEDPSAPSHKNEYSQLDPMKLHHARRQANASQTPAFSGSALDNGSAGLKHSLSPHRYDNGVGKDTVTPRYNSSASPTRPFGPGSFPAQPNTMAVGSAHHEAMQMPPTSLVDADLALAFRGMAVEVDDIPSASPQQAAASYGQQAQSSVAPHRGVSMPQPAYGAMMPQPADYSGYYANASSMPREGYVDYSYTYEPYRTQADPHFYPSPNPNVSPAQPGVYAGVPAPAMHPSVHPDIHRQQGPLYFDYTVPRTYYPPVMYPSSPMASQAGSSPMNPATDKKHGMQAVQGMGFPNPIRASPTPLPQPFSPAVEYAPQMAMMVPTMTGYHPAGFPIFPPGQFLYGRRAEPLGQVRSSILEEFRGSKTKKWELRHIFGHVVEFSGDQHGSRFIQQKIETATTDEKQVIFDEVVPSSALQLIQDVFGNYVIQRLFEYGTQVQKTILANTMEGHIFQLSMGTYGCRVVQRAIEHILPDQQAAIIRELEPHVLECVKNANGNHVIQKLIERVSPERLPFLSAFCAASLDLATHPYGCRVFQRCLEHLPENLTRPLIDELQKYAVDLMQDQFGNYVIQYVLEHGKPQDRSFVCAKIRGQIMFMARHKFASNVCEKALMCADADNRRLLIHELMAPRSDGVSPIIHLMKDQFGNYVLQRAINLAEPEQRQALIKIVAPQVAAMRAQSNTYSKHLLSIERLLEKYSTPSP